MVLQKKKALRYCRFRTRVRRLSHGAAGDGSGLSEVKGGHSEIETDGNGPLFRHHHCEHATRTCSRSYHPPRESDAACLSAMNLGVRGKPAAVSWTCRRPRSRAERLGGRRPSLQTDYMALPARYLLAECLSPSAGRMHPYNDACQPFCYSGKPILRTLVGCDSSIRVCIRSRLVCRAAAQQMDSLS